VNTAAAGGKVYVAGKTRGGLPVIDAGQPVLGGDADGFIAAFVGGRHHRLGAAAARWFRGGARHDRVDELSLAHAVAAGRWALAIPSSRACVPPGYRGRGKYAWGTYLCTSRKASIGINCSSFAASNPHRLSKSFGFWYVPNNMSHQVMSP